MNSEREIVKRLFESTEVGSNDIELDEKTYTIGDTQYWKRSGKFYKWTEAGGRQEVSEEDYMKALSGGKDEPVKPTEPSKDHAKDKPKNIDKPVTKLSNPSINDVDKALTDMFPYDSKSGYETIGGIDWAGDGSGKMRVSIPHIDDTNKVASYIKRLGASGIKIDSVRNKHGNYDTISFKFDEPKKSEVPKKSEAPKKVSKPKKPERDASESDRISYDGVKDFDHTTWFVDGYDTTISRNKDSDGNETRGYYLQNDDFDMEFDTKGDLVRYLKSANGQFQGYDSENDY